jgi:hypothetical protein
VVEKEAFFKWSTFSRSKSANFNFELATNVLSYSEEIKPIYLAQISRMLP